MGDILSEEGIDKLLQDTRERKTETIDISLDDDVFCALALEAHQADVTLNEYICALIDDALKKERMANLIQRVLVRTDLQMPAGLLAAQVAHLHATYLIDIIKGGKFEDPDKLAWIDNPYLFVHGVPNLETLTYYCDECYEAKVPYKKWEDTIYMDVYEGKRIVLADVLIGICIGPDDSDVIKKVVGDLPLL